MKIRDKTVPRFSFQRLIPKRLRPPDKAPTTWSRAPEGDSKQPMTSDVLWQRSTVGRGAREGASSPVIGFQSGFIHGTERHAKKPDRKTDKVASDPAQPHLLEKQRARKNPICAIIDSHNGAILAGSEHAHLEQYQMS